jgi:hypothetical protein
MLTSWEKSQLKRVRRKLRWTGLGGTAIDLYHGQQGSYFEVCTNMFGEPTKHLFPCTKYGISCLEYFIGAL